VPQHAQIAVYFAPNTDQGFYNAIAAAIHDATNSPSVISISWGRAGIDLEPAVAYRIQHFAGGRSDARSERLRCGR
jgi:hypothetical protein